ncbi:hypothetical protein ACTXM3_08440 [Glutamicibacter arilaitensis]|uniref:hypothetical protein n=1 Tax=Glutamicibacter arilaitensis TaxID=256701 RepID=UPI003FD4FDBC
MKGSGASLGQMGAAYAVLQDFEGSATESGSPYEQLLVMAVLARVGMTDTFTPINITHLAEQLGASKPTIRRVIAAVDGELLNFEVKVIGAGRGRRVNTVRPTQWFSEQVQAVLEAERS